MEIKEKLRKRHIIFSLATSVINLAILDKKLILEMKRYALAGIWPTLVDFASFYLLSAIVGLNYLLAAPIAFLAGLVLSYVLSIKYVFKGYYQKDGLPIVLIIFLGINLIGLLINEQALWLGVGALGMNSLLAKLIASAFVTIWNFLAKKWFLFNNHIAKKIENKLQNFI